MDKTVEKIVYLDSIFVNIVALPVLPSPPSPESNVVVYSKESLIPGRLWDATLNWGKGFSFRKGVVLEIVLLRRKVDMIGKTFSSSFVRDCSLGVHSALPTFSLRSATELSLAWQVQKRLPRRLTKLVQYVAPFINLLLRPNSCHYTLGARGFSCGQVF